MAKRLTHSAADGKHCRIIEFTRGKGGRKLAHPVVVKRCDNRKLSTSAKRRWDRTKGKVVCRNAKTKRFKACR